MPMTRRAKRRLSAVLVGLGGIALALVFVRVSLDWSDAQPYEGEATEIRYMVFATIAGVTMIASVVAAIVLWRRAR
ncbi:hypothetical protein ACFVTX_07535 [Agromyces sp. NPDC058136]|uniref:hypothetical protein n=1 Tax=Agromyces sp. NPDC058136 TaxID=3346354 RepID=UPI0036DCF9AE